MTSHLAATATCNRPRGGKQLWVAWDKKRLVRSCNYWTLLRIINTTKSDETKDIGVLLTNQWGNTQHGTENFVGPIRFWGDEIVHQAPFLVSSLYKPIQPIYGCVVYIYIIVYNNILYCITWYIYIYIIIIYYSLFHFILNYIISYYIVLYYIVLYGDIYYIVLYCNILLYIILYYIKCYIIYKINIIYCIYFFLKKSIEFIIYNILLYIIYYMLYIIYYILYIIYYILIIIYIKY